MSARVPNQATAASALGGLLMPPFQFGTGDSGEWWILDMPELHLGADVLVPALAGWRRERMPALPMDHVFSTPPDWVCEVISPSNVRVARLKKMPLYTRHEVAYAWLLDPEQQLLEAYRRQGTGWLLGMYGDEPVVRVEPFESVELDLTLIWGELPV